VLFGLFGSAQGAWAARIPWIVEHLHLSPAQLGVALFGPAVGGLTAMPLAPILLGRVGSRRATTALVIGVGITAMLPPFAPGIAFLWLALLLSGLIAGLLDVSMNAHGVAVERARRRPILSGAHGSWSLGALVGAATGGLVAHQGVDARPHLVAVGLVIAVVGALIARRLHPTSRNATKDPTKDRSAGPVFALPSGTAIVLGLMGFGALFAEAAVSDWSALFLATAHGADPGTAAAGYAAFSICMAGSRFAGDSLTYRFGRKRVLVTGAVLSGGGIALAATLPGSVGVIGAFALSGVGTACVFPLVLSEAGATESDERRRAQAIAAVATTGYLGWLVAPPLIGGLAEATSIAGALLAAALVGASVGVLALARRTGSGLSQPTTSVRH
jgi:MFS family permease